MLTADTIPDDISLPETISTYLFGSAPPSTIVIRTIKTIPKRPIPTPVLAKLPPDTEKPEGTLLDARNRALNGRVYDPEAANTGTHVQQWLNGITEHIGTDPTLLHTFGDLTTLSDDE